MGLTRLGDFLQDLLDDFFDMRGNVSRKILLERASQRRVVFLQVCCGLPGGALDGLNGRGLHSVCICMSAAGSANACGAWLSPKGNQSSGVNAIPHTFPGFSSSSAI